MRNSIAFLIVPMALFGLSSSVTLSYPTPSGIAGLYVDTPTVTQETFTSESEGMKFTFNTNDVYFLSTPEVTRSVRAQVASFKDSLGSDVDLSNVTVKMQAIGGSEQTITGTPVIITDSVGNTAPVISLTFPYTLPEGDYDIVINYDIVS